MYNLYQNLFSTIKNKYMLDIRVFYLEKSQNTDISYITMYKFLFLSIILAININLEVNNMYFLNFYT